MDRTATEKAGANQGVRIYVGIAQELVAMIMHAGKRARHKARERRSADVHFVGEHPKVAGAQTPILAALQSQYRQRDLVSAWGELIRLDAQRFLRDHGSGALRYSGAHSTQ